MKQMAVWHNTKCEAQVTRPYFKAYEERGSDRVKLWALGEDACGVNSKAYTGIKTV